MLSKSEQKVFELIKENPMMSQQEIADKTNLPRSTVATCISSLVKKNFLVGRAYIINDPQEGIYCVGGMNVDRKYHLDNRSKLHTSNPATSSSVVGGVVRNIAENLGRLGHKTLMVSMAGQDHDYEFIKQQSDKWVDFRYVKISETNNTGAYTAILEPSGDLLVGIADMSIYDEMSVNWIKTFESQLLSAKTIVIDLNTPKETVKWLCEFGDIHQIPVIIIGVSGPKMNRLPESLKGVSWLIVNQDEVDSVNQSIEDLFDLGLENLIITRGTKSTQYYHHAKKKLDITPPLSSHVVDVTGAGDSFSAGLIHGIVSGLTAQESIELAMTNAYHTVEVDDTVRQNLSKEQIEIDVKQLKEKGLL